MPLAPGEELIGLLPSAFRICTNERGDEFFPMPLDQFQANVQAYRDLAKRSGRSDQKDCKRLGPIPKIIYSLTVQQANNSRCWDSGEHRDVWWAQVITGERNARWVPYGPGGLCGVWIDGTPATPGSQRHWKDR